MHRLHTQATPFVVISIVEARYHKFIKMCEGEKLIFLRVLGFAKVVLWAFTMLYFLTHFMVFDLWDTLIVSRTTLRKMWKHV